MTETGLDAEGLTTLIPLLLVLVGQFSTILRDTSGEVSKLTGSPPLLTPLEELPFLSDLADWWPQLGRINFLHTMNVGILGAAFILVLTTPSGPTKNVVAFVVGIVWLQLPLLEIDAYGAIREATVPYSLYWHFVTTFVVIALMMTVPEYEPARLIESSEVLSNGLDGFSIQWEQLRGVLGLIAAGLLNVGGFLVLLESELETAADDSPETVQLDLELSEAFLDDINEMWREEGFNSRGEFLQHAVRDAVEHPSFSREAWKQIATAEHDLRTGDGELVSREEIIGMIERDDDNNDDGDDD